MPVIGTRVKVSFQVRDLDGNLYDPPSNKVKFIVYPPPTPTRPVASTSYLYPADTPTVGRDGVGLFWVHFIGNAVGKWKVEGYDLDIGQEIVDRLFVNYTV